jgi:hypothetical protein
MEVETATGGVCCRARTSACVYIALGFRSSEESTFAVLAWGAREAGTGRGGKTPRLWVLLLGALERIAHSNHTEALRGLS